MSGKTLIAIMGPTASGKTDLAIHLAQYFQTEIINVDSRQCFRELNIGTAKPDKNQLAAVKHHFVDWLSVQDDYSAGKFGKEANILLKDLFRIYDLVIAVGGSTLYYKAFLNGLDEFPAVNQETRDKVRELFKNEGLPGLINALETYDPAYLKMTETANARRLMRALEVSIVSEFPYSELLKREEKKTDFRIIKIGLEISRPELYKRINKRCERMIESGLLKEVKDLLSYKNKPALNTVGYSEFFDFLDGKLSYAAAVEKFKQHTRNYAKRQMTWFRKEENINWFSPEKEKDIIRFIENN